MTSIELHCRLKLSLPILRNDADIVYLEEQAFPLHRGSFALFFTDGIALQRPYLLLVLHLKYVYHYFVYIEAYYSQVLPFASNN